VTSPFLLYHKIDHPTADVKIKGAFTTPAKFEKQIRYLNKLGISVLTASDMIEYYKREGRFPDRTISLTFDDGWKDNYTNAFPIMKKYGVTATIFLVPSLLGKISDHVTADGEGPREHMSEDDVREMSAAGIEFGSHTTHHKLLHQATDEEVVSEITESKKSIEDIVQKECRMFAYPAGFFTDLAVKCVADTGYAGAFSTVYGQDNGGDLYRLNRTEILRRDGYPFKFGKKIRSVLAG
jgi:peptidoglycan/xylan/chitin deacetylase (PgdA/CDA1 family)